mmetsp:Transcript_70945/g.139337  ORF Transcript_70945/g.139337 Transcript_70945/m.139337 type:complete len:299 (+) Transcript_70945:48-944(+)
MMTRLILFLAIIAVVSSTSGVPSPSPTVIASVQPSVIPTLSPSFTPAPSAPPTKQTSPIVIFFTNITLSGVAHSYIDADGLNVVALTVANTWNFPSNAVRSLGYAQTSSPSNSAASASGDSRNLRTLSPVEVLSTTNTLIAILKTSVALSATQYASDEALYSTSVSTLSAQINNGQFSTNLQINAQTAGATDLFNANATNAVSSDYTTAYSGAGSTTSGLSSGETAGVVISILFVSFVVAYFAYRRYSASSASQPAPGARGYVVSEDDDYVENPVHTFGENEELRDSRKVHVNDLNML